MADVKNKATAGIAPPASSSSNSILGKYLPEGVTEKDIVVTGELPPQFLGKQHLARALAAGLKEAPEVVGYFDRVEVLPVKERTNGDDFSPFSLLLRDILAPTIGFRGPEEKRVEINVDKGGKILLPITGQVSVNREIMEMIRDVENIYLVGARPIGEEKVNDQPSKMVKWKIEVVNLGAKSAQMKRSAKGGQWALPPEYVLLVNQGDLVKSIREREHMGLLKVAYKDGIDLTPAGNVINRTTGELIGSLSPQGRLLAATAAKPSLVGENGSLVAS